MLEEGMDARFARHKRLANKFRDAMTELGIGFLPNSPEITANTLTAAYYPQGVNGSEFLGKVGENGVVIAGGLLPSHKTQYFRVGHMGIVNDEHIDQTVTAIKKVLG
jgi:alanine-glyoxylate transaminase/serine-glyoxylate transaminase/serine-pyruvate transaminase